MMETATRICLCVAMIGAVALAEVVDVMGPETCPNTRILGSSSGSDCKAVADPDPEESLTSTAVAGVVFVQLVITVLVAILFQRHMKPKAE